MDERVYQIGLTMLPGIGPRRAKQLVSVCGSAEAVFREKFKALSTLEPINRRALTTLNRKEALQHAEMELEFVEKNDVQCHYFQDSRYPSRLKNVEDSPVVLFGLGALDFSPKCVAVVGTRGATSYGRKVTEELIAGLVSQGVVVISGLAHGIDKTAHEAAMVNGLPTIGVLGHGLDMMYPAAHRNIARRMLANGGLVTEFPTKSTGDPSNFPKRNRIIAGLADAVVVVESSEKGGSMITANLANDYNRDVFAFPGNADREISRGCNDLIRRNKAHLITSAEHLIDVMGWQKSKPKEIQTKIFAELSDDEKLILRILKDRGDTEIDHLSMLANLTHGALSMNLFNLEIKGMIRAMPGKRYAVF